MLLSVCWLATVGNVGKFILAHDICQVYVDLQQLSMLVNVGSRSSIFATVFKVAKCMSAT